MNAWTNPISAIYLLSFLWLVRRSHSILDIGCGRTSPVQYSRAARKRGIDGFAPALEAARERGTHTEYCHSDIQDALRDTGPGEFEAVVALDFIEHLPRQAGESLLLEMERIASRRVVVFTPNGFMPQTPFDNNDLQEHLSGWTVEDFRSRGYSVAGMHGARWLRDGLRLKYRPHFLWGIVSALTQMYCFLAPRRACHLLAWKDV